MRYSTSRRVTFLLAPVAALALAAASPPDDELRKGPLFLLIRGGGLESPVVIHHGPDGQLDGIPIPGKGPLSILTRSLERSELTRADMIEARYYEVAEFLWADAPAVNGDGSPAAPLRFEDATALSRIYPDAVGGPLWNPYGMGPVIMSSSPGADLSRFSPQTSRADFHLIQKPGRRVLEAHGLVFGQPGPPGG